VTHLRIDELDAYDDTALRAWYDVYRAAESTGREFHTAFAYEEVRANYRADNPGMRRTVLVALDGDDVVGVARCGLPQLENLTRADVSVGVRPDRWGEGIGTALLARAEQVAREAGRTVLMGEASYPASYPPDGRGHPSVEFAVRHGYSLDLGDLQRVLDLPVADDLLDRLAAQAAEKHAGYTLLPYVGAGPAERLLEIAPRRSAVDSEAPMGEVQREAGRVDEARVRAEEAELSAAGRTRYAVVAVAPDGSLAGYTDLVVPEFDPPWIFQWGTLVWPAHRGHALGLALKVHNLRIVQALHPDRTAVRTWNAEVNAPMIAVNEALGFRVVERLGEFHKRLD
jgi:GNAT superfamily N-acetyltransferase